MTKKKRNVSAAKTVSTPKVLSRAPQNRFLLPILLVALALRLGYFFSSQSGPFFEPSLLDAKYYHEWALRVARGDFGNGVFYGLPLYPFFLGLVYTFLQNSLIGAKLVQVALGLVTVFFIYRTGEEIGGKKVAWISGLLAACYGPLIFHEQLLIPEALGIPLYAAGLYYAIRFLEKPSERSGLFLGVLLGLCMLTKAGVFFFVLIFLGSRLFSEHAPKFKRPVTLCLAAFFLTLAPVTAHNMVHGKDLVFLTSHAGFNFYIGNNEQAEGVFKAPEGTGTNVDSQIEDSRAVAERAMGRSLKPSEVSRYWSDKGWTFIHAHPAKFFELCARKFALFFDSREISDVEDYQFAALFDPFLRLPWPNFAFLGPFFFLGLVLGWKKIRHNALILLWIAGYIVGMLVFFVNARYRLPLLPVLIPVGALGLTIFIDDFMEWRLPRVAASAAILAGAFFFTHLHLVGTNFSRDYVNAGDAWLEKGEAERALPLYEKAIEIQSDNSKAYLAKAIALTSLKRDPEAKAFYERAIELNPTNSQAHNNLGLWYDQTGDSDTAEKHFLKAIEIKPNSAQPHNNLGMIYGNRRQYDKALAEFEAAIQINPKNARAYTNIGLIYYQAGQPEKARQSWEKALSVDPQYADAQRALSLMARRASGKD